MSTIGRSGYHDIPGGGTAYFFREKTTPDPLSEMLARRRAWRKKVHAFLRSVSVTFPGATSDLGERARELLKELEPCGSPSSASAD